MCKISNILFIISNHYSLFIVNDCHYIVQWNANHIQYNDKYVHSTYDATNYHVSNAIKKLFKHSKYVMSKYILSTYYVLYTSSTSCKLNKKVT